MLSPSTDMSLAPGYTPLVGAMASMLNYTRATTIAAVQGLSQLELDHQYDPTANPIGALLVHICAIEWSYIASTLGGSPPSDTDWAEMGTATASGAAGVGSGARPSAGRAHGAF